MKKIIPIFMLVIISCVAMAQDANSPAAKMAVMTPAFLDTVKKNITTLLPLNYNIKLSYISSISVGGKLIKPLITKVVVDGPALNDDFAKSVRPILLSAPAWQPAIDSSGKAIEGSVKFDLELKNNKIKIVDRTGS